MTSCPCPSSCRLHWTRVLQSFFHGQILAFRCWLIRYLGRRHQLQGRQRRRLVHRHRLSRGNLPRLRPPPAFQRPFETWHSVSLCLKMLNVC